MINSQLTVRKETCISCVLSHARPRLKCSKISKIVQIIEEHSMLMGSLFKLSYTKFNVVFCYNLKENSPERFC